MLYALRKMGREVNHMNQQKHTQNIERNLERARDMLRQADAVMIGAGAGLSTAAGFEYSGPRFQEYFHDFEKEYGFHDMYSGGFYPYETPEEKWAFWSRNIWINRYASIPGPAYNDLFRLVRGKDYFVLTTNVDHCFQRAGFDKARLFYTQGDYGLFQCSKPCRPKTWSNEAQVRAMVESQGFTMGPDNALRPPMNRAPFRYVPPALTPKCPVCGRPMTMNLRSDETFVEDDGWHAAAGRYESFVKAHRDKRVVYLEIGVGYNTPGIIKYNFWQQVCANPEASYICLNVKNLAVPEGIADRGVCLPGDSAAFIAALAQAEEKNL